MGGSRAGDNTSLTIYFSIISFISGPTHPLKNHKNIGFLYNTGPDPLKNHKATKPEFNIEPSMARQQNAIKWRFAGVRMMDYF